MGGGDKQIILRHIYTVWIDIEWIFKLSSVQQELTSRAVILWTKLGEIGLLSRNCLEIFDSRLFVGTLKIVRICLMIKNSH